MLGRVAKLYPLYLLMLLPNSLELLKQVGDAAGDRVFATKFIKNAFLIQTLWSNGTSQSINSVSWFFSCIVLIYSGFPVLLWIKIQSVSRKMVLPAFVCCLMCIHFLDGVGALYAHPVFRVFQVFCGMLIPELPPIAYKGKLQFHIIEVLAMLLAISAYFWIFPEIVTLFDTAACFLLIYVLGQNGNGVISRILGSKIMCSLSKLSDGIFLIHGPVLFILGRKLLDKLDTEYNEMLTSISCAVLVVVLSILWENVQRKIWPHRHSRTLMKEKN